MKQRSIVVYILLSLVTYGVYGICQMIILNDETNVLSGRQGTGGGLVFLLSLITYGTYSPFWMYQMGSVIEMFHDQHGEPRGNAPMIYLLLSLSELGTVAYALLQNELNKYLPSV